MAEKVKQAKAGAKAEPGIGYGCKCGFRTTIAKELRTHCFNKSREEGKGTHRSIGKVNMLTGSIVAPPYREAIKSAKAAGKEVSPKITEELAAAQQITFVPRVFTCDYTPIMRAAWEFVVREWGWRPDMPFENFLDTILHAFFKDRGVILAGYIVEREGQYAS